MVLVYCKQGANRSACWALLCMCVLTHTNVDAVHDMMKKVRPIVSVDGWYRPSQ